MWGRLSSFVVLFLVSCSYVLAASALPQDTQAALGIQPSPSPSYTTSPGQLDATNRFLSAELTKQIKAQQEEIVKQLNDNNDANVRILDERMTQLINDTKIRVIIGGIGAVLVAQAIVAIFLMRSWRRHSFEYYQQQVIGRQAESIKAYDEELNGLKAMQQATYQQPQETIGMVVGPSEAMNMSQLNQWQMTPAYNGAWVPPRSPSQADLQGPPPDGSDPNVQGWRQ